MPIINGQKMACAPCIRGHRSTKCNHFYERVMVPVRKPGRPLSTCPCPPGRPCSCGGVRVAIPKKQKCGCSSGADDEDDAHPTEPSPAETPISPSRPSFRVSKTNGSRASSRKQSFDPANLDRMDPRSINLIAAASTNGNGVVNGMAMAASTALQASHADLSGFGTLGMVPAGSSSGYGTPQTPSYGSPFPQSIGFQYAPSPQLQHPIKMEDGRLYSIPNGSFAAPVPPQPFINGNHAPTPISSPPQAAIPTPSPASKTNGASAGSSCCCGSKAQALPSVPAPVQVPAATPAPSRPPVPQQAYGQTYSPQVSSGGGGSCCGSKAQSPPNGNHVSPSQQGYSQAFIPPFQLPTVFTYPGDYGSWQHPIDPVIWQQVASQTGIALPPPLAPNGNGTNCDTAADVAGTSHQCTCGEGCQCVGCLAHPFNAQMFQYVNNAYSRSNGSSPGATDGGSVGSAGGGVQHQQQQVQTGGVGAGQESPAEAPTPAGSEGSPGREEPSLSTLDYFFVNLPVSGLCGGLVESCPCGDSCDCAGCLVHNIPEVSVGRD